MSPHRGCCAALVACSRRAGVRAGADPALDARLKKLEEELRCLVCQNQTLADSERAARRGPAPRGARRSRSRARTTSEIKEYLVARYGDFVLYNPPVKAHDVAAVVRAVRAAAGRRRHLGARAHASRPRGRRRRRAIAPDARPWRPASRRRASCSTIRAADASARGVRQSLPDALDSHVARAASGVRQHSSHGREHRVVDLRAEAAVPGAAAAAGARRSRAPASPPTRSRSPRPSCRSRSAPSSRGARRSAGRSC